MKIMKGLKKDRQEVLRLVLVPSAVLVKKRRRIAWPTQLHVRPGNLVSGSVRDLQCDVLLDSGCTVTVLYLPLAKRLGLVTGREKMQTGLFNTWYGAETLQFIHLKSVMVTLGCRVKVCTPVVVLPEECERGCLIKDVVVMPLHVLQRGHAVQSFHGDSSTLYIRNPERLQNSVGRRKHRQYILKARGDSSSDLLTVLLDTGADNFHVSEARRHKLMLELKATLPPRATLCLGRGCCLDTGPLDALPSGANDFVMGNSMLHKYNAILDYSRHSVTFTVGELHFKVKLCHL